MNKIYTVMKKLSIITCTYNSERYIQECIDSVIAQNLNIENYEHIFVDAYSTDGTKKIIKKYMKNYSNVKLIQRKPKWVYNAMNEWIKEAKWEYIMCLNSDDYLQSWILKDYLSFIKETKNKDVYYWMTNVIENWEIKLWINRFFQIRKILFKFFWCNVLVLHHTTLVKKESLMEMWLFDENMKVASDYWMWLKMLCNKKTFLYYPKIITNFRKRDSSVSTANSELGKQEVKYYQSKYLPSYKTNVNNVLDKVIAFYVKIIDFFWK